MDPQFFFDAVLGLAAFFGGWVVNNITRTIERLDEDIRNMPVLYVTKDDYRHDIDEIKNILGKIFDRLEARSDK